MKRSYLTVITAGLLFVLGSMPIAADEWTVYDDIGPDLLDYQNTYPALCERHDLGLSVQNRHLWAIRITDNIGVEEDEPEFKYISTMHGDEPHGTKMCMLLIDYLLTNYGSDPQVTNLVDEVDIWIVPLMNPDGYDLAYPIRENANDEDLNRNFPEGTQGDPNTTDGREPETAVVMNWSFANSFTLSANFHTGTVVVNYPFDNDGMGSVPSPTPDDDMFIYISEEYSQYNLPMWNSPTFYHGITNGADWYAITGGMQDWSYRYMGCNEVTIEISYDQSPPMPPTSDIPIYWNDNRDSMLAYMETCLIGVRGLVTDSLTGDPIEATVTVVGRDHDIYTDPDVGDYHRMLLPDTYDLTFEADGYDPVTVTNVVVEEGPATRLDVLMGPAPPVTQDVYEEVDAKDSVGVGLVGYDPDSDPLDFIITSLPDHGDLSDPNGGAITSVPYTLLSHGDVVTYTADDYAGPDSFQFKANDGGTPPSGGDSNTSTVFMTVYAAPPVITTASLPDGYLDYEYAPVQLTASNGQPPLEWSVTTDAPYSESDLGSSQFAVVGVARNWKDDDGIWSYTLPFTSFPFYDEEHTSIRVCANGWIDFGSHSGSTYNNSTSLLISNKMIAPLWDDLRTDVGSCDIYIDESVPDEVTIRWDAVTFSGEHPVSVSATLTNDGAIRFHYGSGNTGLTPTIGISSGDGERYVLSMYNGAGTLTDANSVETKIPDPLPAGMTLDTSGQLSGTPTESGSFEPIFVVTDSLDRTDQKMIPLVILDEGPVTGDYDGDGDVDLEDFGAFQRCFEKGAVGNCLPAFDFDDNEDVDLVDLPPFISALEDSGPG